jgi:hypothetical protein
MPSSKAPRVPKYWRLLGLGLLGPGLLPGERKAIDQRHPAGVENRASKIPAKVTGVLVMQQWIGDTD